VQQPDARQHKRIRATISRASETVKQRDARVHNERVRATTSRASERCSSLMPDYMISESYYIQSL
jgi:hypothetical protein